MLIDITILFVWFEIIIIEEIQIWSCILFNIFFNKLLEINKINIEISY